MNCERKLVDQWIDRVNNFKNDADRFFDAIMELNDIDDNRSYQTLGLKQVDDVLIRGEELCQRAEQFLEFCLVFDSSDAKRYELISEIVATNNLPREKVEAKLEALSKKFKKLVVITKRAKASCDQLHLSFSSTSAPISLKELKDLELWLRHDIKFYKAARELVEEFWLYLSPIAQDSIEKLAYSLLEHRANKVHAANGRKVLSILQNLETVLNNPVKGAVVKKATPQTLPLLFSRHDTESVKFINSVLQHLDQAHPNKDWYDALLMEKCLDSLMDEVGDDISKLVPYTKEMDDELEILLDGVEVD